MKLQHHFLVATISPEKEHPFDQSVLYICEHSPQGAVGLLLNKPLEITLPDIAPSAHPLLPQKRVLLGGPHHAQDRGFILHKDLNHHWEGTRQLASNLFLTTTNDLFGDLHLYSQHDYQAYLGYTYWSQAALKKELLQDQWIVLPYQQELLFQVDLDKIWLRAYDLLGIYPEQFHSPLTTIVH